MNDQCHDCKIRKLCYLEEPEEDWTCDHYEPCEYDEEVATDINVGDKDTISRKAAIEALEKDMALLDHIIKGMSANDVRLDAYVSQRNQVSYDIYTINNLPPVQPAQLGTNLAEVGTDCISRQALLDKFEPWLKVKDYNDDELNMLKAVLYEIRFMRPAQPEPLQPWEVLAAQAVLPQPKMGKWIYHIDDLFPAESTMECNQCHAEQPLTCDDEFCPHCGAKMEVTA